MLTSVHGDVLGCSGDHYDFAPTKIVLEEDMVTVMEMHLHLLSSCLLIGPLHKNRNT